MEEPKNSRWMFNFEKSLTFGGVIRNQKPAEYNSNTANPYVEFSYRGEHKRA